MRDSWGFKRNNKPIHENKSLVADVSFWRLIDVNSFQACFLCESAVNGNPQYLRYSRRHGGNVKHDGPIEGTGPVDAICDVSSR